MYLARDGSLLPSIAKVNQKVNKAKMYGVLCCALGVDDFKTKAGDLCCKKFKKKSLFKIFIVAYLPCGTKNFNLIIL